ncbi:MAG: twin-arginine translocation signal domain-containing protein [Actinophytocola sp.]|nr:twin-arginine translocation signal domain-containing protein [Actinophytocola sp.]
MPREEDRMMADFNDRSGIPADHDRRQFLKRAGYSAAAAAALAAGGGLVGEASAQPIPGPPSGGFDGMRVTCPCFGDLINLVTSEGTFPFSGKGNVGVVVKGGPDPNKWGLVVEQHEVKANDTPFGTITVRMADEIEVTPESMLSFDPMSGGFSQEMVLPISIELEHCGANGEPVMLRTLPDAPVVMGNVEPQFEFPPKNMPYQSGSDVGLYAMGADGQVVGSKPLAVLPVFSWTVG